MFVRKFLLCSLPLLLVLFFSSCGGGKGIFTVPPPVVASGYSLASLNGTYILSIHGTLNLRAFNALARLTADGKGNVTGSIDTNEYSRAYTPNLPLTGTYTISKDGSGKLDFTAGANTFDFFLVLSSTSSAKLVAGATSTMLRAELEQQTATTVSNTAPYIANILGADNVNGEFHSAGMLNFSTITAGGELDWSYRSQTFLLPINSGTNDLDANGRGMVNFDTDNGSYSIEYYVIDASRIVIIGTTTDMVLAGTADLQSAATFTTANLTGSFAYFIVGQGSIGEYRQVGRFTTDGAGNITAGQMDVEDGEGASSNVSFTGTYLVFPDGRVIATFNTPGGAQSMIFWLISQNRAALVAESANPSAVGEMRTQTASLTNANVKGPYVLDFYGYGTTGTNVFDTVALVTADGNGNWSGTANQVTNFSPITQSVTGTYSVGANGRGTALLGPYTFTFYMVDSSTIYVVSSSADNQIIGQFHSQK